MEDFIKLVALISLGVLVVAGVGWLWKTGFNYLVDYFGANIKHIGIWQALVIIFLTGWGSLLKFSKN